MDFPLLKKRLKTVAASRSEIAAFGSSGVYESCVGAPEAAIF